MLHILKCFAGTRKYVNCSIQRMCCLQFTITIAGVRAMACATFLFLQQNALVISWMVLSVRYCAFQFFLEHEVVYIVPSPRLLEYLWIMCFQFTSFLLIICYTDVSTLALADINLFKANLALFCRRLIKL